MEPIPWGKGFDSRSDAEFVRFLSYTYRSATEVQSHLYVARDQAFLDGESFAKLYDQTDTTKKLLNGFIRYLERQQNSDMKPRSEIG